MLAVVKNQVFRKENRGRLELTASYIGAALRFRYPPSRFVVVVAGFVSLHLLDNAGVRHRHRAALYKDLIPVGMVAVVMCVKGKPYRLVCQRANFADDELCPCWEVRVDDQNIVFKYDP